MSLAVFILFNVVWMLAGFLTGITSFGGNIVAIPIMTLFTGARDAIVYGCIAGTAIFLGLGLIYFRRIPWRETVSLGLCGLLGVPVGVYILRNLPPRLILLVAGICIALFLLWQIFAKIFVKNEHPISSIYCIPFGFLSGVMMSAIGMGPPALGLYAYLRHWDKETALSGVNMALSIEMLAVIPSHWLANLLTPSLFYSGLWLAGAGFIGILVSIPVERRVNIRIFRILLLVMLGLSALMLLIRSALG